MLALLLVAFGAPALPQESPDQGPGPASGSIQGVVTAVSPSGESTRLAGVTLNLVAMTAPPRFFSALTNAEGHYQFDSLAAGTYRLQAQVEGLEPFTTVVFLRPNEARGEQVVLHIETVVQKVDVHGQATSIATESAAVSTQLSDRQFQTLPLAEQKFKAALPLVPGVVRTSDGRLNIKGESENQGMLLVDSAQTVDPVTGSFSIPIPIDAIHAVNVYKTPYDSEYGGFSGGLTAIDTKPPSASWNYGLMDFVPGVRGKAGHIVGVSDDTPRFFLGGPILKNKLNFSEAATYDFVNKPVRGLPWPHNESRVQGFAPLSSFQAVLSPQHIVSATVNGFSSRVRYADIDSLVPQPASSDDGLRGISVGANDNYQLGPAGVLDTVVRYTRFDSNAHGQGPNDMLLTPEGWGGNFFNAWSRASDQFELLSLYQFPQTAWLGRHEVKLGADVTYRSYEGNTFSHPIQVLRQDGSLAERIEFQGGGPLRARDTEVAEFLQDHWSIDGHLAFDLGSRLVSQSIGRSAAFAPRAGMVYSPGDNRKTIVRAGTGLFYDRVPLLAADFADNPTRVVTPFDGSGLPLGPPVTFQNAYVQTLPTPFASLLAVPRLDTSARNLTSNAELDREISRDLMVRVSYLYSRTENLYVVSPFAGTSPAPSLLGLTDTGESRYREIETTLHYRRTGRSEFNVSYVRSRGRGDLNTLSAAFVPFQQPVVRPNLTANLASDVPNRVVGWGIFALPWKLTLSPIVDARTGFPYSTVDTLQNYVGAPNAQRFPAFFSLDAKLYRDFKLGSFPLMGRFKNQKVRFGLYSINLTNHLNCLDVYNNVASPYFGHFAGFQHRVDGLVMDLVD